MTRNINDQRNKLRSRSRENPWDLEHLSGLGKCFHSLVFFWVTPGRIWGAKEILASCSRTGAGQCLGERIQAELEMPLAKEQPLQMWSEEGAVKTLSSEASSLSHTERG